MERVGGWENMKMTKCRVTRRRHGVDTAQRIYARRRVGAAGRRRRAGSATLGVDRLMLQRNFSVEALGRDPPGVDAGSATLGVDTKKYFLGPWGSETCGWGCTDREIHFQSPGVQGASENADSRLAGAAEKTKKSMYYDKSFLFTERRYC